MRMQNIPYHLETDIFFIKRHYRFRILYYLKQHVAALLRSGYSYNSENCEIRSLILRETLYSFFFIHSSSFYWVLIQMKHIYRRLYRSLRELWRQGYCQRVESLNLKREFPSFLWRGERWSIYGAPSSSHKGISSSKLPHDCLIISSSLPVIGTSNSYQVSQTFGSSAP